MVVRFSVVERAVDHLERHQVGFRSLGRVGVGVGRILGDRIAHDLARFVLDDRRFRVPCAHVVSLVGIEAHAGHIGLLEAEHISFVAGQHDGLVLFRAVAPCAVDDLQGHGHADLLAGLVGFFLNDLPLGYSRGVAADDNHVARVPCVSGVGRFFCRFFRRFFCRFLALGFRRRRADQPALELRALRRGEAALRQRERAALVGLRRRHLALAAVGVKGDRDRLRGLLPLGNHGRARRHGDRVVGLVNPFRIDARRFRLRVLKGEPFLGFALLQRLRFHGHRPAGKLHALRRGEAALRQDILIVLIRLRRVHLALAAVGVKGNGDRLRDRLPLRRQRRVAGHGDRVAHIVNGLGLRFSLGFGLRLRLRFGFGFGHGLRRLRCFHRQRPAGEFHALRRGEAALRQRIFALRRDLDLVHLALAAVRVERDRHHVGQQDVRDPDFLRRVDRVIVLLDLILDDRVRDLPASVVYRHAVEAEVPSGLLGFLGLRSLAGFGLRRLRVVAAVHIRRIVRRLFLVRFLRGRFDGLRRFGFGLVFFLAVLVVLFRRGSLLTRALLVVRGHFQQRRARALRRHLQRGDLLAVRQQPHGHALRPLSALVARVVPEHRAAHAHYLRGVRVRDRHVLRGRIVALDLVLHQAVVRALAVLVGRILAEVIRPAILCGHGLAVELLFTLVQVQRHALGPQAVAVVIVVPGDRAARAHRRARRVDQRQDQAAAHQGNFLFFVARRRVRRVAHLKPIAVRVVRALLAVADALPHRHDLLRVASQHRSPAIRRRHGLRVHMLGILVRIHFKLYAVRAQAVLVVHILPHDIHGCLALRKPLARERRVLHHHERIARAIGLVHRLARRVPALEVAPGLGGIVFIDALRHRDLRALEQQVRLGAFLFFGLLGVLIDLPGRRGRVGLVLLAQAVRRAFNLRVLARRQIRRAQPRLHRHGHIVHVVEVRAPDARRVLGHGSVDHADPAEVEARSVEYPARSEQRGVDHLCGFHRRLDGDVARYGVFRLLNDVGRHIVEQIQVRERVPRHGDVAILAVEGVDMADNHSRGFLKATLGPAVLHAARSKGRQAAHRRLVVRVAVLVHADEHLTAHILQLGIVGVRLAEDAVLHVQVRLAGGRVDLGGELLEDLLGAQPDGVPLILPLRLRSQAQDDGLRGMLPQEVLRPFEHLVEARVIPIVVLGVVGAALRVAAVDEPQVPAIVPVVDCEELIEAVVPLLVLVVQAQVEIAEAVVHLLVDIAPLRLGVLGAAKDGAGIFKQALGGLRHVHRGVVRSGNVDLVQPALAGNARHPVAAVHILVGDDPGASGQEDVGFDRIGRFLCHHRVAVDDSEHKPVLGEEVLIRPLVRVLRGEALGEHAQVLLQLHAHARAVRHRAGDRQGLVGGQINVVGPARGIALHGQRAADVHRRVLVAGDIDAAAHARNGVAGEAAAGQRQLALGVNAAAVFIGGVALDRAVVQRQAGVLLVPDAAAVARRAVTANLAVRQRGRAAVVVVEAAAAFFGGLVFDDAHVLQRQLLRAAVEDAAAVHGRVADDRAARHVQRAVAAAVDAAAAGGRLVGADHAARHLERAVRVHAAAPLRLVPGNGAALKNAGGALGDVDAAAALRVAALDHARAPRVADRQRGLACDLDHVPVVALAGAPAVHRVAIQVDGDGLAAVHLDAVRAVGGNVVAQRDHLTVLRVLDRLLQATPVGHPHVRRHGEVDRHLAVLQAGLRADVVVIGKVVQAAVPRQPLRQHVLGVLRRHVQLRALRERTREPDHIARTQQDVRARRGRVVLHRRGVLHVHGGVRAVQHAAALHARAVARHAAAIQVQRAVRHVDAAAVPLRRRIAGEAAAGDRRRAAVDVHRAARQAGGVRLERAAGDRERALGVDARDVVGRGVARNHTAVDGQRAAGGVVDPAAVVLGLVAGDAAALERQRAVIPDAAGVVLREAAGDLAAARGVHDGQRAAVADDEAVLNA